MKILKLILTSLVVLAISITGCKKSDFVEINTDPNVLYTITPEEHFLGLGIQIHRQDFEQFYDNLRRTMFWMQQSTPLGGNSATSLAEFGNTNYRFGVFYPGVGRIATDVSVLAQRLPEVEKAKRQHVVAMAEVLKIYYGFYVSDINGHLAYSEAFIAPYGGTNTPKWESQQELFGLWDTQLKQLVTTLRTATPNQVSLANFDQYYGGDAMRWAKAANALRQRIAMRLTKRDLAKATAIFRETIADAALLMSTQADSWVYTAHTSFTQGGNWNPDGFRAPKPSVDFMWGSSDPRLNYFYGRNNYSQANINTAITAGILAAGTTEPMRRHVGVPVSPDVSQAAPYPAWFSGRRVNGSLTMDTMSFIQHRLHQPAFAGGDGQSFFPLINYADQLLMRAEMAARGITTENAQNLYNLGVRSSIEFYSQRAGLAKVADYAAVTEAQIISYLEHPLVKWDNVKSANLIASQAFLNFYKQPNEAWALFKRTGMPNKNTVLENEDIVLSGTVYQIPRRAIINIPAPADLNRVNRQSSIDEMMKDPDFGADPSVPFGRIWWDKK